MNSQENDPQNDTSRIICRLGWIYTEPEFQSSTNLTNVLKLWHRAKSLGLSLAELTLDGRPVGERALEHLNLFILADGAWRISALPYWEARAIVEDILSGSKAPLPQGPSSGGRLLSRPVASPAPSLPEPLKVAQLKPLPAPKPLDQPDHRGLSPQRRAAETRRKRRVWKRSGPEEAKRMADFDRQLGIEP